MKYEYQNVGKKTFQFDRKRAIVRYVYKATPDMVEEENEWMEKHGRPLYGIDEDGYMTLDSAGLSGIHWDDKEFRMECLSSWCLEIEEETNSLVEDYIRYELEV